MSMESLEKALASQKPVEKIERKISEQERQAIRGELLQWMRAEHKHPTHETRFTDEEAQRWVDYIFDIKNDGTVTVQNMNAFEPIVRAQKGLPPYITGMRGRVAPAAMQLESLQVLRGITINGDLSLSNIKNIEVPDGLDIKGRFIITDTTPATLIDDVAKKYGREKIKDLRTKER